MQLSYLLSVFLASLTIASPVANPNVADDVSLATRATDDTAEYKAAIAAHPNLSKDKYYYFTLEWPLGTPVGDGDTESGDELKQLQQKLGFEHIGVVVGQIIETETGKGKNKKTKRDFKATLYHMTKKNKEPGDTEFKTRNYSADSKQLKWGGETSKKKADAAKKAGKDYVDDNKIYKVDGNNCADFAQSVLNAIKRAQILDSGPSGKRKYHKKTPHSSYLSNSSLNLKNQTLADCLVLPRRRPSERRPHLVKRRAYARRGIIFISDLVFLENSIPTTQHLYAERNPKYRKPWSSEELQAYPTISLNPPPVDPFL
ncbi:hypothetical protein HD806DRAFT_552192 [Xylariaceae sp. AK1471]|nr:hypothetical protein HD806DRAFT_552192 [Xylariaceae sp. AK1471]